MQGWAEADVKMVAAHLRLNRPPRLRERKPACAGHPLHMKWIVRSSVVLVGPCAAPPCLQISCPALETQAKRSTTVRLWWFVVTRYRPACWWVGLVVAGASRPGGTEAGDGGEKVAPAAAGEDGEAGDQRVVARDQRRTVLGNPRIAPPSAGEEPVSCHTATAWMVIAY